MFPVDVLIEALWPEAEPRLGRQRLRNVLTRCRTVIGRDIVTRSGDLVGLTPDVSTDLMDFEAQARLALAGLIDPSEKVGAARAALALVSGPLLQDEPYMDLIAARRMETNQRVVLLIRLLDRMQAPDEEHRRAIETMLDAYG
jgi:DNA-binding SARP family transcriptional activator